MKSNPNYKSSGKLTPPPDPRPVIFFAKVQEEEIYSPSGFLTTLVRLLLVFYGHIVQSDM